MPVTDRFHAKQGRSTGRWILQADGQRLAVALLRLLPLPLLLRYSAQLVISARLLVTILILTIDL